MYKNVIFRLLLIFSLIVSMCMSSNGITVFAAETAEPVGEGGTSSSNAADVLSSSSENSSSSPSSSADPSASVISSMSPVPSASAASSLSPSPSTGASVSPSATISPSPTPVKVITSITAVSSVTTIAYGSTFDTSTITVTAVYSDGTKKKVSPDWVSPVNTSILGKQLITVEYQTFQVNCSIEVVPRQVTNLQFKTSDESSMTITWDALEEAKKYNIYMSSAADESNTSVAAFQKIDTTEDTEYTFQNLKRGDVIYIRVKAVYNDLEGEFSDIMPVAPKPAQVIGVTAIKNVKTKITLSWEAAEGATEYAIYYRLSTDTDFKYSGSSSELTYQVTGLKAGKDYYFIVYAFAGLQENLGEPSEEVLFGTAPSIPTITKVKGGDKRVKVYWKKGSGADSYDIYVSPSKSSGYELKTTVKNRNYKIVAAEGLKNKKKYYIKVVAVRTVSDITMESSSTASYATTKKAKATSTKAKLYKTKAKFKKSVAYKKYKDFSKKLNYKKSYAVPGQIVTNVAGFNASRMVPQSVTFAGKYMLVSAYDYTKAQESVIYVMDKVTGKYKTTIVLPHTGHVGGITYDGVNVWITHGKRLECFPYRIVQEAVSAGAYLEIYDFLAVYNMSMTASYLAYYKDRLWMGTYSETSKKYMYGYTIQDKSATPYLQKENRILMPNRTQGVVFTSGGKMIISRSCQTNKLQSGFMSQLDTYKPTWNLSKNTIRKNKRKKVVKMPPMNEGIAIYGSYTYVIYESSAFSDCEAPLDRITAFKTSKIS